MTQLMKVPTGGEEFMVINPAMIIKMKPHYPLRQNLTQVWMLGCDLSIDIYMRYDQLMDRINALCAGPVNEDAVALLKIFNGDK